MDKINRQTAAHYAWGAGCEGWHLVQQPDMSVIYEHMPPGTSETRHFHRAIRQFFHVQFGELALEVQGKLHLLHAGDGLEVAPGQIHQAYNKGAGPVEFLVISNGVSRADRIER